MEITSQPINQNLQLSAHNEELLQGNVSQNSKNQGSWTNSQQKKYIVFLEYFKKVLQNRQKRKNFKIFKEMAKFITSRDGIQCRSHHMKLLRTHSKIRKIISHFKKQLNFTPEAESEFEQLKNSKSPSNQLDEKPRIKKQVQTSYIFLEQNKIYPETSGSAFQFEQPYFLFNNTTLSENSFTFSMPMPVLLYSPVFFI